MEHLDGCRYVQAVIYPASAKATVESKVRDDQNVLAAYGMTVLGLNPVIVAI